MPDTPIQQLIEEWRNESRELQADYSGNSRQVWRAKGLWDCADQLATLLAGSQENKKEDQARMDAPKVISPDNRTPSSVAPTATAGADDERDARRYRRLRVLGCAPGTWAGLNRTKPHEQGTVLCFQNLDQFVDDDLRRVESRGEAQAAVLSVGPAQEQDKR